MIDIKAINITLAQGNKLIPETFRQLDGAVVHLELKWEGTMIMNGNASIWHITDDNTAFGEITDEDDGNVFRGTISRHTIDKIISVPQTTAQVIPTNNALVEKLKEEMRELMKEHDKLKMENRRLLEEETKLAAAVGAIKSIIDNYMRGE